MTVQATVDYAEPNPQRSDQALRAQAMATVMRLLGQHPETNREVQEIWRTRVHLQEQTKQSKAAEHVAEETAQYEANLTVKFDPAGRRSLGFGPGIAVVIALVILDAFPLNWAAQAFGLDQDETWIVTFVLVVAAAGAMLGFELTRGRPGRRRALTAVVAGGYLALLGLRTEFLATVSADSLLVAFLQSALLTAISAGLLWCGSAILARTRFQRHSRARRAALQAARHEKEAGDERLLAEVALERNVAILHRMLFQWALGEAPPPGIDHAQWSSALHHAIHDLFPAP